MTHSEESVDRRTSHFVTVEGGVKLHALDWGGDGPPLVLVHGSRRTGRSWNAVARRLSDSFRVIALDTRGHGDSDCPETGHTHEQRAADIAVVTSALRLPPHFVMGHSLGGGSSALYAARFPHRVRAALLIEPTPDGPAHWVRVGVLNEDGSATDRRQGRNSWPSVSDLRSRLEQNRMTAAWTEEVLLDVLREETVTHPDGQVEIKWSPLSMNYDELRNDVFSLVSEASRMSMPIMVMVSAANALMESHLRPFVDALPVGELVAVEGVGHSIYMEVPELVADRARTFFLATAPAGGQ
ncbi:MAG: alpha/beta hydrolase [Chloroflexi bacterium]|nr:alpha/beta hydrolase [Chloroflexota bacterium]